MDWTNIHNIYVCRTFQRIIGTTEQELINLQCDGLKQFPDDKIDSLDIYKLKKSACLLKKGIIEKSKTG